MVAHRSRRDKLARRLVSIPALTAVTLGLTVSIPIWLPIALAADAVRLKFRFPVARLLAFGVCWGWIELVGIARSVQLWITGKAADQAAQYELMGWWSGLLMKALGATVGVQPRIEGLDAVEHGHAIVLSRHASLADSLVSGWVFSSVAGVRPRFVLKRELLFDPCLDIVGLRVPNHFLDREAVDGGAELQALSDLGATVGDGSVAVIFPEGTRSNPTKRARILDKVGANDPERAMRLSGLRRLLPPRPAGSAALLGGAPDADVILAWHTGFDGLDSFGGIIDKLSRPLPTARFVMIRVPRSEVPDGQQFADWLDERWIEMDQSVDLALSE